MQEISIANHLESLSAYGATAVRVVPNTGEPEDLVGEGGELADRFDELGRQLMVDVMRDARVEEVLLADGELQIELRRTTLGAKLRVAWGTQTVVDEEVDVPPPAPVATGPFFRPDPDSEVVDLDEALSRIAEPAFAVADVGGMVRWYTKGLHGRGAGETPLLGSIPATDPSHLGSATFRSRHGVKWAYVAGAMAGGIASADMVIAMARAGLLGFFGSGGLPLEQVEAACIRVKQETAPSDPWGFNLLHNPNEPEIEEKTVDLYLKHEVRRVSASAYMELTPAIVRYRLHGIHKNAEGRVVCPNHVFAKVSRPEVATHFLRPAPQNILDELEAQRVLTREQTALAATVPMAEDITAEADSGGHTDHRPLLVILPELQELRDQVSAEYQYAAHHIYPRVGAAGGLGTPAALWGAFAIGADYVLTGSVNQASVEAGTSNIAKRMLAQAAFHDVASGPAPDMFELGAKVQVLSRGSMYAQRAQKLYDLYRRYESLEEVPPAELRKLERIVLRRSIDDIWTETEQYWQTRDARQLERAGRDPHYRMALVFRWYLGMTSRWARLGTEDRKRDFQMWCGPSMGAFNSWAADKPLNVLAARGVVAIAEALMSGASVEARRATARTQQLC